MRALRVAVAGDGSKPPLWTGSRCPRDAMDNPGYSGAFVGYIKRHPSINQTNHPDQLPAYGLAVDASAAPDRVVGRRGLRISASFRLVVAVLRQRPSRFPT